MQDKSSNGRKIATKQKLNKATNLGRYYDEILEILRDKPHVIIKNKYI